jgi:hypothetical protein
MAKKMPAGFKDPRKKAADKAAAPVDKASMRVSKRGAATPAAMPSGAPGTLGGMGTLGLKKGGACKGYKKGGAIDGVAKKGHTKGTIC